MSKYAASWLEFVWKKKYQQNKSTVKKKKKLTQTVYRKYLSSCNISRKKDVCYFSFSSEKVHMIGKILLSLSPSIFEVDGVSSQKIADIMNWLFSVWFENSLTNLKLGLILWFFSY